MRLAVLGAGAWGTALAIHFAREHETSLWVRDVALAEAMRASRTNSKYLPDCPLPASLEVTPDFAAAVAAADIVFAAVPTVGFRALCHALQALPEKKPVIWACKGFEQGTAKLPHEVLAEALPDAPASAVLSGPTFAQEVARGLPCAVTLASRDRDFAQTTAKHLNAERLRIYSSDDVVGVELGGAVKNVMAIAAGISDGMGFGLNARASLITRGLAEITRLGLAFGGRIETLTGLSGVGDLILTCTGELSRNRRVGLELAQGQPLEHILSSLGHVAEGVSTAREVVRFAETHQIEMPVTRAVCAILHDGQSPKGVVEQLLRRAPRPEVYR